MPTLNALDSLLVEALLNLPDPPHTRRRYHVRGMGDSMQPVVVRLVAVVASAIAFSISFTEEAHMSVPIIFLGGCLLLGGLLLRSPGWVVTTALRWAGCSCTLGLL